MEKLRLLVSQYHKKYSSNNRRSHRFTATLFGSWVGVISRRLYALRIASFTVTFATTFASVKITPVTAADYLVVRYGPFSETISLAELQTIAQTGEFPSEYEIYTKRLSTTQKQQAIAALRTNLPVNVVMMDKLLNTRIGNTILSDFAKVVIRKDDAGAKALRSALVLGSSAPQGLSPLTFLAAYPSQRLEIDLNQAFNILSSFNVGFWQTQQFMNAVAPLLTPPNPNLSFPFAPEKPGTAQVQVLEQTFNDNQRKRQIPANIYWSSIATYENPVILFTHGLGSVRTELKYLAEHLASHGYIIVAIEHPGSNMTSVQRTIAGKTRLMQPQEFIDRPQDISFVLDQLTTLNQSNNSPLKGKLGTDNTLVVGYSFGGATALAIAGAELQLEKLKTRCQQNLTELSLGEGVQCIAQELPHNTYQFRDRRVKRVIAFNPSTSLLFGDTGLSKVEIPTLLLAASADKTTPAFSEQIIAFSRLPQPKALAGIVGATHLSVKDPSTTLDQAGQIETPLSGGEIVGNAAIDIRNYTKAITLAYAAQMTSEANKYASFLSANYAQFASTKDFPIRFITEIPPQATPIIEEFLKYRE